VPHQQLGSWPVERGQTRIDPDPARRGIHREVLEYLGWQVTHARDIKAALEHLEQRASGKEPFAAVVFVVTAQKRQESLCTR